MDFALVDRRMRATYWYLRAKLFVCNFLSHRWTKQKMLGTVFMFSDAKQFVEMFRRVFVEERYFFKTDNPSPMILDCGPSFGLSQIYFRNLYPDATIMSFDSIEKCHPLSQFIRKPVDLLRLDFQGSEAAVLDELSTSSRMAMIREIFVEFRHDLENDHSLPIVLKALRTYRVKFDSRLSEKTIQEILMHAKRRPHVSAKKANRSRELSI